MSFGDIRKEKEKEEIVFDGQTAGLSQEARENLRTEFVSLGGIVTSLPDPSEVKDFTISVIMDTNITGAETATLYMMINGKWFTIKVDAPLS